MQKKWKPSDLVKLRSLYPHLPTKEVAKALNCSEKRVSNKASALGLKKTEDCLGSHAFRTCVGNGKGSRFAKGQVPWNKGRKVSDILSEEALERMRKTTFKKGHFPKTGYVQETGIITQRTDKRGKPYLTYKLAHGKWVFYNRYVWEQYNGPIPPRHVVIYKDGNPLNCDINNLQLISMAENIKRNSYLNYTPDMQEIVRLRSSITRKINKIKTQK